IPGRQINFAIPGEHVHIILNGRIASLTVHQPYFTDGNKLAMPVIIDTIDPRHLLKEVGLEVWAGNKPVDAASTHRPAATTQPQAQAGDSPQGYYKLTYLAPEAKAEVVLPELPADKVYWQQPRWINAKGETHWAAAVLLQLPSQPVYRKPANLVLRYPHGVTRDVDLTIENTFKVSNDEDADILRVRTVTGFKETVTASRSGW